MAKEIINTVRIERTLKLGMAMLEELAEYAPEWDEMPDTEQYTWYMDWEQFIFFLQDDLDAAYQSAQMTSQQKVQYKELLSKLEEAAPTLKKLNLSQSPVLPAEVA